jgi:hypothetical protein
MSKPFANKYAGTCDCGTRVEPGAGWCEKAPDGSGKKWITRCNPCVTGEDPVVVNPTPTVGERPKITATPEQVACDEAAQRGITLAIQALAGTGKTSTLVMIANGTTRTGIFLAFNKGIVVDAERKLPRNVTARTVHSVAYQQVGKAFDARLNADRMSSSEVARRLDIEPFYCQLQDEERTRKVVQPSRLGGGDAAVIEALAAEAWS